MGACCGKINQSQAQGNFDDIASPEVPGNPANIPEGWWIAWAPLVGTFLARICRGRTVREFIFCAIFASCAYNFIFLEILGGAGLKMQLLAEKFGIGNGGCDMSSAPFAVGANGEQLDYKVHPFKANVCRPIKSNGPDKEMFCSTIVNLGCSMKVEGATHPLFHILSQYADAGVFMVIFVIITLTLYFVASSDSGSMVDDMLAANGMPDPCLAQRLYWALTEGAAASALLSVGKYVGTIDGSLKALRAASICVTFNMDYEKQGGGLPVDASGAAGTGMYGVGDRMAKSRRISAFGWFFFFCFTTYICGLRNEVRDIYQVSGGLTEDFFATLIWPTAILQLDNKLDEEPAKGKGCEC